MKQSKKRLVVLFSMIFVLSIVAGYCVYQSYTKYQPAPAPKEEEINLGIVVDNSKNDIVGGGGNGKSTNNNGTSTAKDVGKSTTNNNNNNNSSNNNSNSNKGACCCTSNKSSCTWASTGNCAGSYSNKVSAANSTECATKANPTDSNQNNSNQNSGFDFCDDVGGAFDSILGVFGLGGATETCKEVQQEVTGAVQEVSTFIGQSFQNFDACNYVTITSSGELSPDSSISIRASKADIDNETIAYLKQIGYTFNNCSISYSVSSTTKNVKGTTVEFKYNGGAMIDIPGPWEPCKKVTLEVNGTTSIINVKTKFSDDTKNKNLSGEKDVPRSQAEADMAKKSYYVEDENCIKSDPNNCQVHTRDLCTPTPSCYYNKDIWRYCWGTDCGEGYILEPNVPKEKCINVCYCNKEKNYSGVWALKDWSGDPAWAGYNIVKKGNDYVTNESECKCPTDFCCVNNGTLELSDDASYVTDQVNNVCPNSGWTKLEDVKKEDCVIKEEKLGSCSVGKDNKQTKEDAKVCEGTTKVELADTTQCTDEIYENTNFYEIGCKKTINTHFDYGNDGKDNTVRSLYKGEGFSFGINVETAINCKYIFYDGTWTKVYNKIKDSIKKIDSKLLDYLTDYKKWEEYINNNILNKNGVNNASKLYWYWGLAEELRNVVKAYNEYTPKNTYNEQSELTLTTLENGKKVTNKYKLKQIVKDTGTYKEENVEKKDLKESGVTNPKSYILKSNTARKVTLIPFRVCMNKKTGKITTIEGDKCPEDTIDGGNKIYTSFTTDITEKNKTYPIDISVTGLGGIDYTIDHNKCDLKVMDREYIYRPIDVENPFINSNWKKGKNWVNEKFDFTQVINKDTWSDNSNQKVITLTAKDVAAIKKSNSDAWRSNNSPYMGLCISQSETQQDPGTKALCSLIK